ncbi:hypothetical protein SPRG_09027 [Saprolegnia parasitica CBS 223.65]|uniref:Uncharacterized protein n=1 Tax=Saprolegnia parasitica (strain CBS 223.65) TaxID=695850 RepID=A0A067C5G0_SAPPC|nr:hypothetical protein SPRG_09027 [Saprolegnia parasitica CBS 223.65]KDO25728.1 hypothetical protein SPRG_09027 [Saprolegnia parasitica CBS 223.65]|eukprot:XP_012203538.1 hypothetical protein SPRG_09027 [Saprolegnia parasitica CBS 223.65]
MAGVLWVTLTLAGSIYYLYLLQPRFANDLIWPFYNTSGYRIFFVDVLNAFLETAPDGSLIDVGSIALEGRYEGVLVDATVHPTYAMSLLAAKLTTLEFAIGSLRNLSVANVPWLPTAYCWVDLHQAFELAHTEMRQQRCRDRYAANGAVYLEAILRNTDYNAFLDRFGGNDSAYGYAIERGLMASARGVAFLDSLLRVRTTVADEAVVWRQCGITRFCYEWQNAQLPAVVETATIMNALGVATPLTLKSTARNIGAWTSSAFHRIWFMDLVDVYTCSLIRDTLDYYGNGSCYSYLPMVPGNDAVFIFDTSQLDMTLPYLGPYFSVDLWVVPPPASVVELVSILSASIYGSLNSTTAAMYNALPTLRLAPMPLAWTSGPYVFYGGSPLCTYGKAQAYLLPPFSMHDRCVVQAPWTISLPPISMIAALVLVNDTVDSICALQSSETCSSVLSRLESFRGWELSSLHAHHVRDAAAAVANLDVSIIQLASDVDGNYTLLIQPLLETAFAFYGWALLLDWVHGRREVVSFEGDDLTLVLISDAYDVTPSTSTGATLGTATIGVYYALVYACALLGAVTVVTILWATYARNTLTSINLFAFNRVAGSTWLGRPLLLLRGMSAILLLSSAPIDVTRSHDVFMQLALPRRSVLETLLLAWEATWISYVLHELLLPLDAGRAFFIGSASTGLAVLGISVMELGWPTAVVAAIDRPAKTGDPKRLVLLLWIPCVLFVPLWLLLSGVGRAFLACNPALDGVGRVASGLFRLQSYYTFDLKLWRVLAVVYRLVHHPPGPRTKLSTKHWVPCFWVLFGAIYVSVAIYSSAAYLDVAQGTFVNDLIWPRFNMTGAHLFLAQWMASPPHHLLLDAARTDSIALTNSLAINGLGMYNDTKASILVAPQQGARVQYTSLIALDEAIVGLRSLHPCDAPWVFTPYCYLDLDRTWEMANSRSRQARCLTKTQNGAVYLASLLRNVDLRACWGDAFEVGFATELRRSTAGIAFLASIAPPLWQNYKSIGLLHSYDVVNAYGAAYPFTLQSTVGHFRLSSQTSLKMYWGLAHDLTGLVGNTSALLGGKSLLRMSSNFAFANGSLQDALVEAQLLPPFPWTLNYRLLSSYLGPFGSIDMIYVPVPRVLQQVAMTFGDAIAIARQRDPLGYRNISAAEVTFPVPSAWRGTVQWAMSGSALCPIQTNDYAPQLFFLISSDAFDKTCSSPFPGLGFLPSRNHVLFALLLANVISASNLTALCVVGVTYDMPACVASMQLALAYALRVPLPALPTATYAGAIENISLQVIQFGSTSRSVPTELYVTPFLDPLDAAFNYHAWLYLYDWILGQREVISFQADNGTLTLLGAGLTSIESSVDTTQLSTVFSLYALQVVRYVTFVMLLLAAVTAVYILAARGHVEGQNMLELSRVGGIVWVGRPLIVVRGITAICLLSTSSVELETDGILSFFVMKQVPIYMTCLAANEVTWFVGVVNDVSVVMTQNYTMTYAMINSLLVWLVSACLATLAPVRPTVTIAPTCRLAALDFQVVCSMGQYLFSVEGWIKHDTYYLDRASGVLNGLLSQHKKPH